MLQFTPREEAALGNWKDLVSTPTYDAAAATARSMSVHYDEAKLQLQAVTKVAVVMGLQSAVHKAASYNVGWDVLRTHLPDMAMLREWSKQAGLGLMQPPSSRSACCQVLAFDPSRAPAGWLELGTCAPVDGDSHDDAESESSESGSAGGLLVGEAHDDWEWMVPPSKGSLLHTRKSHEMSYLLAACGRHCSLGSFIDCGIPRALLQSCSICPSCLNILVKDAPDIARSLERFA